MHLNRPEVPDGIRRPAPSYREFRQEMQELERRSAVEPALQRLRERLQGTGGTGMTAIAEDTTAPPALVAEPATVPAPDTPEVPEPEPETGSGSGAATRAALIAEVRTKLNAAAERMITARRMCTGDPKVISGVLCDSGTQEFMAKGKLHPPGRNYEVVYQREPAAQREAGERLIREGVWKPFGGDDTSLGDFTLTGLRKRLQQAVEEHDKWVKEFRQLIVDNCAGGQGYITTRRRDEAFSALNFEPWQPQRQISYSISGRVTQPTNSRQSAATQARALRDRIVKALRAEFGDELGDETRLPEIISVNARDI